MNLADPPERLQVAGEIGAAHRDPDAVFTLRQRPHDMAAEKAGAAENRDQGVGIGLRRHWLPLRRAPARSSFVGRRRRSGAAYRIVLALYRATRSSLSGSARVQQRRNDANDAAPC